MNEAELSHLRDLHRRDQLLPLIAAIRASAVASQHAECQFRLGDALRQIGRSADAQESLQTAIGQATGDLRFNAQVSLALLQRDAGQFAASEQTLAQIAAERMPLPGWFWVIRASAAANQEQFAAAIDFLHVAEASDDVDLDEVYLNLAYAYRALEETEESAAYAAKVLALNSDLSAAARQILITLGVDQSSY
ncbi:tetratricopeptide repeat protein [Blastopirellula marina]|uniref:Tetratricopeptide repeat protein n=1 Tax=Blastopirellula marina TaxID=124 RepID=A0A2S8GTC2_9BACT|nr:hypothetical protein [Blastopirellula marina]PQO47662.1 hypothetical protein C5Y93_03120 [Blastopirellula marina]